MEIHISSVNCIMIVEKKGIHERKNILKDRKKSLTIHLFLHTRKEKKM